MPAAEGSTAIGSSFCSDHHQSADLSGQDLPLWQGLFPLYKAKYENENPQNLSPAFGFHQFTEDSTSRSISHTLQLGSAT